VAPFYGIFCTGIHSAAYKNNRRPPWHELISCLLAFFICESKHAGKGTPK
jgi:hypothetical protein